MKRVWTSRGHYTSTFIQDTSNNIWAVGANGYGQLGLGHTSHVKIWTRVPGLDMVKNSIHDIKGDGSTDGSYMSTIVHETYQGRRQLFGTGYNGVGQLAVGDYTNRKTFTRAEWGPREVVDYHIQHGESSYAQALFVKDEKDQMWVAGEMHYYMYNSPGTNNNQPRFTVLTRMHNL